MHAQDPAAAAEARLCIAPDGNGRRDLRKFKTVLSTWSRTRETSLGLRWKELDKAEYKHHWLQRGRKKKQIKKMWQKATTAKKFKQKKALYKGKRIYVWVALPREMSDRDVIANGLSCTGEPMMLGAGQMQEMMFGEQQLAAPQDAGAMFGGLGKMTNGDESSSEEPEATGDEADSSSDSDAKKKKDNKDNKGKKKDKKASSSSSGSSSSSQSSDDEVAVEKPGKKKNRDASAGIHN